MSPRSNISLRLYRSWDAPAASPVPTGCAGQPQHRRPRDPRHRPRGGLVCPVLDLGARRGRPRIGSPPTPPTDGSSRPRRRSRRPVRPCYPPPPGPWPPIVPELLRSRFSRSNVTDMPAYWVMFVVAGLLPDHRDRVLPRNPGPQGLSVPPLTAGHPRAPRESPCVRGGPHPIPLASITDPRCGMCAVVRLAAPPRWKENFERYATRRSGPPRQQPLRRCRIRPISGTPRMFEVR